MPSLNHLLRSWLPAARPRGGRRLGLEALEAREVPAIALSGTPTVFQSPGPVGITNGGVVLGAPDQNIQIGAVEKVALDPFNANRAVVGAVNGGLWTTDDITAATPVYTPTGDKLPSLAISSVAFSPVVPNLVFAGTGSFTAGGLGPFGGSGVNENFPGVGGAPLGVYRSADGGRTWTLLGQDVFGPRDGQPGVRIRDVVPTRLNGGDTVLVAVNDDGSSRGGVYRSDDRGQTWRRLSGTSGLPALGVTSLITDANATSNKFYAFAADRPGTGTTNPGPGAGVYVLDATGGNATWVDITSNLPAAVRSGGRVVLASSGFGVNPVYAAVITTSATVATGDLQGVYRAVPFGPAASPTYVWTAVGPNGLPPDISPGSQADIHFAIAADPASDRLVYVGGDRLSNPVFPPGQAGVFAGAAARGDAVAGTWTTLTIQADPPPPIVPTPGTTTPLDPSPQAATAPHADNRSFTFLGTSQILAAGDGGLYRLTNPRSANNQPPVWSSINGNLKVSETYQADLDSRGSPSTTDDVLLAALQDNGSSEVNPNAPWAQIRGGDGTIVRTDDANTRYYSSQNFGIVRRDSGGAVVFPRTVVNNTNNMAFIGGNLPFKTAFELNQADPSLILVAGSGVAFLSRDKAESFDSVGGVTANAPDPVPNLTGTAIAIAYGTRQIRQAAYIATDDGNVSQSFDVTVNRGDFRLTNFQSVSGGEAATDLAMDPENPLVAYAVSNSGVFRTTDGLNFVDISGNIQSLVSQGGLVRLYSLALLPGNPATQDDDVLFAGGFGGVYFLRVADLNRTAPVWVKLGDSIPNVLVSDLRYDAVADTLVAGTYGRGIFTLPAVSQALNNPPTVTVTGDGAANAIAVYQDPTDAGRYVVTDGLGNTQSFSLAAVRNVVLYGTGGADTITIGTPNGGQAGRTLPLGLVVTVNGGGQAGDTLVVDDSGSAAGKTLTVTPTTIGAGNGDTFFGPGGAVTYRGFDAGRVRLRFGTGADQVTLDDSAATAGTQFTVLDYGVSRAAGGNYDLSGAELLNVRGGSGNDAVTVRSTGFGLNVFGGGGDDVFAVAGDSGDLGPLAGPLAFDGGAGNDLLSVAGTAGNDNVTARLLTRAGAAALDGLPQSVAATTTERVDFDGRGGSNTFAVNDFTDSTFGSPADPTGGFVVAPSGVGAGTVRVGGAIRFGVAGINAGLTVNGDPNASGTPDALAVLGTSAAGAVSNFGEAVVADGRDRVTVSDTNVSVASLSNAGNLLSVNLAPAGDTPSFSILYVATGNEKGSAGDRITATPSAGLNIVIDGQGPSGNPGDQLTLLGTGTFTSSLNTDPALGPATTRVSLTADQTSVGVVRVEGTNLPGGGISSGLLAVGSDAGPESTVRVYDRLSGAFRFQVTPFPGFSGGVSVASGDVTGDGIADLIVGAGPGGGPRVAVFNGLDAGLLSDFFGYEASFRGGVNVSAADFDGDGVGDIVLGTGVGGGPRVRILSGRDLSPIRDVFAYNRDFRGGVNVAAGDVTGDGTPDLVTSTGSGGGPRVVVLDGTTLASVASFFVFDSTSRAGFTAAAGDVNGDGFADIIVGSGAGEAARVRVFSGLNRSVLSDFNLNDPFTPGSVGNASKAGVRVTAADANGDGLDDVITGEGPGAAPVVRTFQLAGVTPDTNSLFRTLQEIRRQSVFDDGFTSGVFVGAGD